MRTLIFATAIRLLTPLFLLFSVYILFRGHHHPGGGFIGGLICSLAFVFHALAHGSEHTESTYFRLSVCQYKANGKPSQLYYVWSWMQLAIRKNHRNGNHKRFHVIRLRPIYLMAFGLLLAAGSGMVGLILGKPFMTAWWLPLELPVLGSLGTPLLFDTGVFMLVLGMVLKMVFTMKKE
ncbi:MnhB domain-containing protein [Pontibacter oryzae]|uniref:Cation:proton antiporter n=1 Tax=Pontibacter oryzae TaxID=2304593 RepID=A0A399SF01_9BACT|nr:MnhB domain-containing protein [Pontibacter oryzae]RIJ41768.1 cation:proton antiporter [Pontibacter oryzae]